MIFFGLNKDKSHGALDEHIGGMDIDVPAIEFLVDECVTFDIFPQVKFVQKVVNDLVGKGRERLNDIGLPQEAHSFALAQKGQRFDGCIGEIHYHAKASCKWLMDLTVCVYHIRTLHDMHCMIYR